MAVRLSAPRASRTYPQEDSWYSILLEAESTPGPVQLEGLGQGPKVEAYRHGRFIKKQ
jgi:hypothetical protein